MWCRRISPVVQGRVTKRHKQVGARTVFFWCMKHTHTLFCRMCSWFFFKYRDRVGLRLRTFYFAYLRYQHWWVCFITNLTLWTLWYFNQDNILRLITPISLHRLLFKWPLKYTFRAFPFCHHVEYRRSCDCSGRGCRCTRWDDVHLYVNKICDETRHHLSTWFECLILRQSH